MHTLFDQKDKNIRIVKLSQKDALLKTDNFLEFKDLIISNENQYPQIDQWFKNKVFPGLKNNQRTAFIAYFNSKPVVSAVVKKGKHSKFCHLKINDDFQNNGLGDVFFALMALEVRDLAEEIHFTLPESLWIEKNNFFKSFGFNDFVKSSIQYRLFEEELKCSSSYPTILKSVMQKLPKIIKNLNISSSFSESELMFSIKPPYAKSILDGKKKVEIRRKFNTKWEGETISIYSSSPQKELLGKAEISKIVFDEPNKIWDKFGSDIFCTKEDYDRYTINTQKVYAIIFKNIQPYENGILIENLSQLLNEDYIPPQSYCILRKNEKWAEAISVVDFLQSNLISY